MWLRVPALLRGADVDQQTKRALRAGKSFCSDATRSKVLSFALQEGRVMELGWGGDLRRFFEGTHSALKRIKPLSSPVPSAG